MRLDITCSTDNNYVQHCMAMLCSVFENNKEHNIIVHLLHHDELSNQSKDLLFNLSSRYNNIIKFYKVDMSKLLGVSIAEYHPDLSIATYFRLMLPSLLDETIKYVLYLDCDVIVLKDVSALFQLDLDGFGVAAVKDGTPGNDEHRMLMGLQLNDKAFCAGVLMINLDYWRNHRCQEKMMEYAKVHSNDLIMEDQDVLNHEFRRRWFQLPYKYGYTPMSIIPLDYNQKKADIIEYVTDPSIIHYAAHVKPWLDINIPDDVYYWKYVEMSGFINPKRTIASKRIKKMIWTTKMRYYINYYLHPYVPNIFELLIIDFRDLIQSIYMIFCSKAIRKNYHISRWMKKYDL